MKFCICFFGVIGRSIDYTIDSINENIFNVLKANNIEYDVFIHNMIVDKMYNPRTGEINSIINNENYKLLNPTEYIEDKQEDFDKNYNNWESIFKYGDEYNNDFNTVRNAIRQLYSLKRVTSLWENKEKYDLYLYLRPDLFYLSKLNVKMILKCIRKKYIEGSILTPGWERCKGSADIGINDQVYFGKYDVMLKIAKRIDYLEELSKIRYNSEKFLYIVVKKYNINTINMNFNYILVRTRGLSNKDKKKLIKKNKQQKLYPIFFAAIGVKRLLYK